MVVRRLPERLLETSEEIRARLIAETEAFLAEYLRHPELAPRIPTIQAGRGSFPPSLILAFWEPILNE